jgi:hypothetical protein
MMLRRFTVPSLLVLAVVALFFTVSAAVKKNASTQQPLTVTITPVGPDQATIDARRASLLTDPAVLPYLKGSWWAINIPLGNHFQSRNGI